MDNRVKIYLIVVVAAVFGVLGFGWYFGLFAPRAKVVEAPAQFRTVKITKTYKEVLAAPRVSGDSFDRRLEIINLPAGTAVLAFSTNVIEPFVLPNGEGVSAYAIRAEGDTGEVSAGDIAVPPNLSVKNFENKRGASAEFGPYSVDRSVTLVIYIKGVNNGDLGGLKAGALNFYITLASI